MFPVTAVHDKPVMSEPAAGLSPTFPTMEDILGLASVIVVCAKILKLPAELRLMVAGPAAKASAGETKQSVNKATDTKAAEFVLNFFIPTLPFQE